MVGGDPARQVPGRVLLRLVAHHHHLLRPLRDHLVGDGVHPDLAPEGLSAGHRDRVVVEDLVGDVDPRRHRGPYREDPAVVVGPVAEVGEEVVLGGERGVPDPVHPLAAHVGRVVRAPPRVEHRHPVTADPGHRPRAVGDAGRGVVGAPRAEVRRARKDRGRLPRLLRDLVDPGEALDEAAAELLVLRPRRARAPEPGREGPGDNGRGELPPLRDEGPCRLVPLPDDARRRVLAVVEQARQLVLDEPPLLLDHDELVEPRREADDPLRLDRPGEGELVDREPDLRRRLLVDPEVVEGLAQIEVRLAGGDDTDPGAGGRDDHPVHRVRAGECEDRGELLLEEALLVGDRLVLDVDVEAALGKLEVGRLGEPEAVGVDEHRGRALHRVRDRLEPHPAAGPAARREAEEAEVEVLLDRGGIEDRHEGGDERLLRLVGHGRGLRAVVVARNAQDPAPSSRPREVPVLEDVAAPVHPGALPVPDREHPVVLRAGEDLGVLRAPHGGRREILVEAGVEADVVLLEEGPRLDEGVVEASEGGAAVPRDVARGVEAGREVAAALHHRKPDEGLDAGDVDAPGVEGVLVFEGYGRMLHAGILLHGTGAGAGKATDYIAPGLPSRAASRDPSPRPGRHRCRFNIEIVDPDLLPAS